MKKILFFVMMALVLCSMTLTACKEKNNEEPNKELVDSQWKTIDELTTIIVKFQDGGIVSLTTTGYLTDGAIGTYMQDGQKVTVIFNRIDEGLTSYIPKNTPIIVTINDAYTKLTAWVGYEQYILNRK
ncbi:MAG: hypothetical protein MJZ64_06295 [Paludibacteraceae bacterium]|nr:hypothetical protein [Paludibacteraceae bacterium]